MPQWYQKRFLWPGETKYNYLDLRPETIISGQVRYQRRALLQWGPGRCFYRDDLYAMKLGNWSSDDIEKRFFGAIDNDGRESVEVCANYDGVSARLAKVFQALPRYMDAQRFRTPRGLDQLKRLTAAPDHNQTLMSMQRLFQLHTTMWVEGVWEIARARLSSTKFIVTDEPVSFYNRRIFPSETAYPGAIELDQVGTRTLFPLGLDSCLIITHTQLTRDPRANPTESRVNARAYQPTMKYLPGIQFGRELEEDEVLRINFILKTRATRYIAAAQKEWLYPERWVSTNWSKLDDDWFLLPHLYKVPFTKGILVGYRDGSSSAADEYGRRPGDPKYQDQKRRDREWQTRQRVKKEWAKKRVGKSVAHVSKSEGDEISDRIMKKHLAGQEAVEE